MPKPSHRIVMLAHKGPDRHGAAIEDTRCCERTMAMFERLHGKPQFVDVVVTEEECKCGSGVSNVA